MFHYCYLCENFSVLSQVIVTFGGTKQLKEVRNCFQILYGSNQSWVNIWNISQECRMCYRGQPAISILVLYRLFLLLICMGQIIAFLLCNEKCWWIYECLYKVGCTSTHLYLFYICVYSKIIPKCRQCDRTIIQLLTDIT